MKILKINSRIKSLPLMLFKQEMMNNVNKYQNTKSMKAILDVYSLSDIEQAIDSVYVAGDYICIPDGSRSNLILRLLQYGGAGVKALNIITLSYLGMEGGLL